MARKIFKTDPIINLVANFAHFLYDSKDKDLEAAKGFLKELWGLVMNGKGELPSLTQEDFDRCSEGGLAVHYPIKPPHLLNCFIKKAPSSEWAEQAYKFALRYEENRNFRMATAQKPFYYKNMVLYLTHFVNGLDLDRFLLDVHRGKDVYIPYVEAIAEKSLDDLVFWQEDSKTEDVMILSRPTPSDIVDDLKTNVILAVEHAKRFGSVYIEDEELNLLHNALEIFDELTLNEATIVPIVDYCPKNIGIRTDQLNPPLDEVIKEISTRVGSGKPDTEKIAEKLYHWDPAAKWRHFLEDFFAFFNSYELMLFNGKEGITSLDDRYEKFLNLKQRNDDGFKSWVESLNLGWRGSLVSRLLTDRYLMQFYRAMRKADLSLTRYAWMNEKLGKQRTKVVYDETKALLPAQISFYSESATKAIKSLVESYGDESIEECNLFEKLREERNLALEFFKESYENTNPGERKIRSALYLLYIAYRLKERKIDYGAINKVKDPSQFAKPTLG